MEKLNLEHWSDLSYQLSQEVHTNVFPTELKVSSTHQLILSTMGYDVKVVDYDDIRYSELIGAGANMVVYKGTYKGRVVALKRIRPTLSNPEAALGTVNMEIKIMSDVFLRDHDNIAKLEAFTWSLSEDRELTPVLVMELACPSCPTLSKCIETIDIRDFTTKAYLISDIISALTAIHAENIIHGDLKPENILLFLGSRDGIANERAPLVAKISDFGFCDDSDERKHPLNMLANDAAAGGTEYWNAPECLTEAPEDIKHYARKPERDMYSFGLVVWYILGSTPPLGSTTGKEWEESRDAVMKAKLNSDVRQRYMSWFSSSLQMVRLEGSDAAIETFEAELEEEVPEIDFARIMMINKIKNDPLFRTQVMFDELLFRAEGKVCWAIRDPTREEMVPCPGYLPVMVPFILANTLREPSARLSAAAAFPMCRIVPNRKPAKIYDCCDHLNVRPKRDGWQQWASRSTDPFAPNRKLQLLSPKMHEELRNALHDDADGSNPSLTATLMLWTMYKLGYGVPGDAVQSDKYMRNILRLTENSTIARGIRSQYIQSYFRSKNNEPTTLDPQEALTWAIQSLSDEITTVASVSPPCISSELFELRIAKALANLHEKAKLRFLRLCSSAYIYHSARKQANRTDPLLRHPEAEDSEDLPDFRGPWAGVLLSGDPDGFERLAETGALPPELRLWNNSMDSILWLLAGYNIREGDAARGFTQGLQQRQTAARNLIRICADYGLVRLLKHLADKHRVDINQKLDTGYNTLQETLEQGRINKAVSLLAVGADLNSVAHEDFVRHVCGDGHWAAIDFWTRLKKIQESLVDSGSSNFLFIPHYRDIFRLFRDDNMDMTAQRFERDVEPKCAVNTLYFSIVENCWHAFLALLQYGVDCSAPCMGSLNALETSIIMNRPLLVATLVGPEYASRLAKKDNGHYSLFHLAVLGNKRFKAEKPWVYGDPEDYKSDREASLADAGNHQQIILELILENKSPPIDGRDRFGLTPFLVAVLEDNMVALKWLERNGANGSEVAPDGCTALHLAVAAQNERMVDHILSGYPDLLEKKDLTGQTPLHFAASQSSHDIVQRLCQANPDFLAVDMHGRTALHISLDLGQLNAFVVLVSQIWARCDRTTLRALLNAHDTFGRSCYHLIAKLGLEAVQHIRDNVAINVFHLYWHPAQTQPNTWSAAHFAVVGCPDLLAIYTTKAKVSAPGYMGLSCLHLAYLKGDLVTVQLLNHWGADREMRDELGRKPRDLLPPDAEQFQAKKLKLLNAMSAPARLAMEEEMEARLGVSIVERRAMANAGMAEEVGLREYLPEFTPPSVLPGRAGDAEALSMEDVEGVFGKRDTDSPGAGTKRASVLKKVRDALSSRS